MSLLDRLASRKDLLGAKGSLDRNQVWTYEERQDKGEEVFYAITAHGRLIAVTRSRECADFICHNRAESKRMAFELQRQHQRVRNLGEQNRIFLKTLEKMADLLGRSGYVDVGIVRHEAIKLLRKMKAGRGV